MPNEHDSEPTLVEETTPDVAPKKPEKPAAGPKKNPTQLAAAEYLEALGAVPAAPVTPRVDTRAGKRTPPDNQPEPKLSARQFVRARKQRWERCAGFLVEMKMKLGPAARLTMHEWQPLWDAFWTRPIGGLRRR